MNSIKDLLLKKAQEIDDSGIKTDLDLIQNELDRLFPSQVKLQKINNGIATITTENASVASDLRMQASQLIDDLNSSLKSQLSRLVIRIV